MKSSLCGLEGKLKIVPHRTRFRMSIYYCNLCYDRHTSSETTVIYNNNDCTQSD